MYDFIDKWAGSGRKWKIKEGIAGICIIGLTYWIVNGNGKDMQMVVTFVYFPCIIYFLEQPLFKSLFSNALWGVISEISFDCYLWHICCFSLISNVAAIVNIDINYNNLQTMLIFTLAVWMWGALSYFCLEKPLRCAFRNRNE